MARKIVNGKKMTKAQLKREYIENKLKSSYGGVSSVGMNVEGEDMIINMLALLASKDRTAVENDGDIEDCDSDNDSASLISDGDAEPTDDEEYLIDSTLHGSIDSHDVDSLGDSNSEDDDQFALYDMDSDQDSEVKVEDSSKNTTPASTAKNVSKASQSTIKDATNMNKHQFVRQLIRDERRESREDKIQREMQRKANSPYLKAKAAEANVPSVEDAVSKLKSNTSTSSNGGVNKAPSKGLSVTVRLNIQSDKTGSASKLMVVARTLPLTDLLKLAKSKFNLSAKAKASVDGFQLVATGEVLYEMDMLSIADGTQLRLCTTAAVRQEQRALPVVAAVKASVSTSVPASSSKKGTPPPVVAPATPSYWVPPSAVAAESGYDASFTASITPDQALSATLKSQLQSLYASPQYSEMRAHRESLPIFRARDELLYTIRTNQVTVVAGETGSGKTTQLPLYLYEDLCLDQDRGAECYIVVTQPRRIAAITVAERVAMECNVHGSTGRNTVGDLVGYQIRLDTRCSKNTRILYCTTGVLLRRLQSHDFLHRVSHIILDEVHERQVETDFLMTILKQQCASVPALRIVLMSATMQENLFTSYFNKCPLVSVSGRTYPVTEHYLDEVHKLIAQGQRMTAIERGKMMAATTQSGDIAFGSSSDRKTKKDKKYDDKREERQTNLMAICAPRFDPDTIAELVVRIITTHSKQAQGGAVVGAAPPASLNESQSVCGDAGNSNNQDVRSKPVASGRMALIQRAAASSNGKTTSAPKSNPSTNTSDSSSSGSDINSSGTANSGRSGVTLSEKGDAILVFLSGIQAIDKVSRAIRQRNILQLHNAQLFTLHGSMPPEQQKRVFKTTLPGQWKIVLATNIAETSITVDDVTHVVDAGFVKEMRYDPVSNISSLQEAFVSRAAARQRSGRAGRVRAGHAWRVYSQEYFQSDRVDDYSLPEIQRIPLEEVVLQVLLLKLGRPEHFLSQCLESPSLEQIKASVACLLEIGAVLPLSELPLTALGYHLAKMPVDVRLGKMLIYGSLLQCVEPVLTIAAALGGKSPFFSPPEQRGDSNREHNSFLLANESSPSLSATTAVNNTYSDHLAIVAAYDSWLRVLRSQGGAAAYAFCREKFLSHNVLLDMEALREHFRTHLISAGFLPSVRSQSAATDAQAGDEDDCLGALTELTVNDAIHAALDRHSGAIDKDASAVAAPQKPQSGSSDLIKCILCAGLAPQLVRLRKVASASRSGKSVKRFETGNEQLQLMDSDFNELAIHPSSLIARYTRDILDSDVSKRDAFIVFYKKVASTKVYLFDATVVPHIAVLLFGNGCRDLRISAKRDRVTVGGWIEMRVEELHAVLYKRLQQEIECLLRMKVERPALDIDERAKDVRFIIETLLNAESSKRRKF